jgi:cytoskeletal protein CcmA (bactofilin family)
MAWRWSDGKRHDLGEWTGFLQQGVKIEGRLEAGGTFRIDATMKGTLVSEQTLIIGEHGSIEGEITGNCVIIAGRFDGIIHARGKVEVRPNAIVTGEVETPCLVIEPGAVFDGHCHMPPATQASKTITIPIRSSSAHS